MNLKDLRKKFSSDVVWRGEKYYGRKKVQTVLREKMASYARARGYPEALVKAMVTKETEVHQVQFKDERGRFADFHSLRHTYITNIARLPVSLKTHQELARHSQPALTMRYTHTRTEDKVRALEALPPVDDGQSRSTTEAVA